MFVYFNFIIDKININNFHEHMQCQQAICSGLMRFSNDPVHIECLSYFIETAVQIFSMMYHVFQVIDVSKYYFMYLNTLLTAVK